MAHLDFRARDADAESVLMDILSISLAQLLLGLFLVGGMFLTIAVCYSTLYYMKEDQEKDKKSETSWNSEDKTLDTIEEFRSDFS